LLAALYVLAITPNDRNTPVLGANGYEYGLWGLKVLAKKISEIRRPEIIEALQKSIVTDGVNIPSYDQIANHGEMSRQLIRHYFPDEEEMMLALCETLEQVYRDCLVKSAIAATGGSRLQLFIDFYFNLLSDRGLPKPPDDKIYDALLSYANTHEPLREKLHNGYQLVQMTFAHEIQVSYPELPQSGCKELGYIITATMYGHWKMVKTIGFSESYSIVARDSVMRVIESYVDNYIEPLDN